MTAHKHASLMLQYAQDAAETETPWERWEFYGGECWVALFDHPGWLTRGEYRRKPVMVTRQISYPGPCRDGLLLGHVYWLVALDCVTTHAWGDCVYDDVKWLAQGRVHLTREAAEAHRVALLGGGE